MSQYAPTRRSKDDRIAKYFKSEFTDFDPSSKIAQFYAGKSVLITGATGFLGKALIEKLARSCKDIKRIYLLVRPKKGLTASDRLDDLLKSGIFTRLKSQPNGEANLRAKLSIVPGDITLPMFGISEQDLQLLSQEVSVVFNSAATVRFHEPIDNALRNNIYSVSQLMLVCDRLEKLVAIVHLSTAFSNYHMLNETIKEKFYEPPMRAQQLGEIVGQLKGVQAIIGEASKKQGLVRSNESFESFERLVLNHKQKKNVNELTKGADDSSDAKTATNGDLGQAGRQSEALDVGGTMADQSDSAKRDYLLHSFTEAQLKLNGRPNTYTYTKAIAESYLLDLAHERAARYVDGPVTIGLVRPSIVCGAWREPEVGFVDNYNAATGAILSLYVGALQAMPGDGNNVADIVPIDMTASQLVAAGWFLGQKETQKHEFGGPLVRGDHGIYVFNMVSGFRNPLRWGLVTERIAAMAYKFPSKMMFRLPSSFFVSAGPKFELYNYLNHWLPAKFMEYFMVKVLRCNITSRNSPVKSYERVRMMTDALTPFTSKQWRLSDHNICSLYDLMTPIDRKIFHFDISKINWRDYLDRYMLGARKFTLKDSPQDVEPGDNVLARRQTLYRIALGLLLMLLYYIILRGSRLEKFALSSIGGCSEH